jgi:enoyl-CoA hydratase/carnithine racemase
MSSAFTEFAIAGSVASFTLNRPEAGNAMTWAMYDALVEACDLVDDAGEVRAFVIRGRGGVFCTGTDIGQFVSFAGREDGLEYERRLEACLARLEAVAVSTIAWVDGIAAGAGCAIALACDLRVCTPAARFGVPIARTLGNALSLENCARLVEAFGRSRAADLLLTGRFIDAAEAAASGVVTRLAAADRIADAVGELAAAIARNAPFTQRAAKVALRQLALHRRLDAVADIGELIANCYASDDFREGVSAFLAKRPPRFTGR